MRNGQELRRRAQEQLYARYHANDAGFKPALMQIAEEDAAYDPQESKALFKEYYGDFRGFPLAYKIDKSGKRPHIYVYENNITKEKIKSYARIAEGDGPLITVYIVDRFNRIRCAIDNDELAPADTNPNHTPSRRRIAQNEMKYVKMDYEEVNSLTAELAALKNELSNIRGNKIKTNRSDERAILRAVYELGLVKEGDTL